MMGWSLAVTLPSSSSSYIVVLMNAHENTENNQNSSEQLDTQARWGFAAPVAPVRIPQLVLIFSPTLPLKLLLSSTVTFTTG